MKNFTIGIAFIAPILIALPIVPAGCEHASSESHTIDDAAMDATLHPLDEMQWKPGPPSLPPGAQIAVLEGDPTKAGPFVFRIKAPDGYRIPPHTHPKVERITVIEGQFNVGMGETVDDSLARPMPKGTYGYWPAGMVHFVFTTGETILQFHGDNGPWTINYINPEDDPRNQDCWSASQDSDSQLDHRQPCLANKTVATCWDHIFCTCSSSRISWTVRSLMIRSGGVRL